MQVVAMMDLLRVTEELFWLFASKGRGLYQIICTLVVRSEHPATPLLQLCLCAFSRPHVRTLAYPRLPPLQKPYKASPIPYTPCLCTFS